MFSLDNSEIKRKKDPVYSQHRKKHKTGFKNEVVPNQQSTIVTNYAGLILGQSGHTKIMYREQKNKLQRKRHDLQ